MLQLKLLI